MSRTCFIFILVIFICSESFSQTGNIGIGTRTPHPKSILDITSTDKGILIPRLSLTDRNKIAIDGQSLPDINGMLIYNTDKNEFNFWNNNKWVAIPKSASTTITFNGNRPITADYFTGQNPGTDDLAKWVETVFYPSQGPVADLTVSYNGNTSKSILLEHTGNNAPIPLQLNWTAGRKNASENIASVVVAQKPQTFSNPAQGAAVVGAQLIDHPANTDVTYQNIVTTTDGKTATASVTVGFAWKVYWGFLDGTPNGTAFIPTNDAILGLPQELSSTKNLNKSIVPTGSQRIVIAFPEYYEAGSSHIMISQMDQSGAFDRIVMPVTNALGAKISYVIYISKNNTNGTLSFAIQ